MFILYIKKLTKNAKKTLKILRRGIKESLKVLLNHVDIDERIQ